MIPFSVATISGNEMKTKSADALLISVFEINSK